MPQLTTRQQRNMGDSSLLIMGRDDSHRCAPDKAHGSDAGVTQSSGQKTRIPGLGGAVSDMHHVAALLPKNLDRFGQSTTRDRLHADKASGASTLRSCRHGLSLDEANKQADKDGWQP